MINKETIDRICDMARLEISENDKDKFVGQMNDILGYVESVAKLDTSSVGDRESVFDEKNVCRSIYTSADVLFIAAVHARSGA